MAIRNPIRVTLEQTVRRTAINAATAGNHTLVPAATGKQTKLLGILLMGAGAVTVKLTNGAGGAELTGPLSLAVDGNGLLLPVAAPGLHWLETTANTALVLNLSAATQVAGVLVYYQE